VALDPVGGGLVDEQVVLVGAERDAVGEVQAVDDDVDRAGGGVVDQQPPVGPVLPYVGLIVRVREPCRGLGEVHRPRVGDGQVVGKHDRLTVDVVGQHRDRTVGAMDGDQSQVGVGHHQPPVRVNLDSQGVASGGDHVDGVGCRVDAQNPPVPDSGEQQAGVLDGDRLRAHMCPGQHPGLRQRAVGRVDPGGRRRCRWVPRGRVDPHPADRRHHSRLSLPIHTCTTMLSLHFPYRRARCRGRGRSPDPVLWRPTRPGSVRTAAKTRTTSVTPPRVALLATRPQTHYMRQKCALRWFAARSRSPS
jgi:hypothetical protein